jgi:hypothetical protein
MGLLGVFFRLSNNKGEGGISMRSIFLLITTVVVMVFTAANTLAQVEAPDAQYLIEGGTYYQFRDFTDEPGKAFHEARYNFLKLEAKIAAEDIRKGAGFLRLEAGRATEDGKKALMASVNELEQLAKRVEQGTVKSSKELDDAFAHAHQALAKHHYLKAMEYWSKKDAVNTGHALKAALSNLRYALAWAGHKSEAAVLKAIEDTRIVSEKLVAGAGWVSDEVGKALDAIGKEIEKLDKEIRPEKK